MAPELIPARRNAGPARPLPSIRGIALPPWATGACAALVLGVPGQAQEALRYSLSGAEAAEARGRQQQSQPASLVSGDFRLLVRPSLSLRYNDNVALDEDDTLSDVIVRPMLDVQASYPITERNALTVSLALGYDFYLDHSNFNDWVLRPGSRIGFDFYLGEVWFNLHDDFYYVQDPADHPSVTGTGTYVGFHNTAGLSATWDLQDLVLNVAYDHYNFISGSDDYEYLDRGTELPVARVGYRLNSALLTGLEATGSFTRYDEPVLNDNIGVSVGAYAEWQVGEYLKVSPRAGYAAYFFDQTSNVIEAEDQAAWYASLRADHRVNRWLSYSLQAGHELRLGISSDLVRAWYVRPQVSLDIIKDVRFTLGFPYEHGSNEGRGESYDWFGFNLGLSTQLLEHLDAGLKYRLRIRDSDTGGDYSQNVVELQLTYRL